MAAMLFDTYLFADYSGAPHPSAQRKAIRLAKATRHLPSRLVAKRFTRMELVDELISQLRKATRAGKRVCFGQDHQYSIPIDLGRELGLAHLSWRQTVDALCIGTYGRNAPPLSDARTFTGAFNRWLCSQGRAPYFYSATKGDLYGIPSKNPRPNDRSTCRLTEIHRPASRLGAPKPLNRVGDNGTVGGQSLAGIIALRNLLSRCGNDHIRIAAWPFDGLSISDDAYVGAHVLIEPYPTAVRQAHITQTDDEDALACASHIRTADREGTLATLLDLSQLNGDQVSIVRFEGWIVSHIPGGTSGTKRSDARGRA